MLKLKKTDPIGGILLLILLLNFVLRLCIILFTDLGVDEVYYVLYPMFPDWSYFDHPPIISILIGLTTFNLHLMSEFFVRLGPLIIGTANIYLIYYAGKMIWDRPTGLLSAAIYCCSFYASIVVGTFIMPDTPQSLLWIFSLILFIKYIRKPRESYLILFGITVGLAMLSKYHAVYLWGGAILFFLIIDRKKLLSRGFIISVLISFLLFLPVILWNYWNSFSSFQFHAERVEKLNIIPSFDHIFIEIFGEIFYNNPFVFSLVILSLLYLWRRKKSHITPEIQFLLLTSLPLIGTTLLISLYNATLPHWTGPAYFGLILLAGYYSGIKTSEGSGKLVKRMIIYGNALFVIVVVLAMMQIHYGLIWDKKSTPQNELGLFDPSLDMWGWAQVSNKIDSLSQRDMQSGLMDKNHVILTNRYFPGAHIDYYYAMPHHYKLYVIGEIKDQHLYAKINMIRGNISPGTSGYFITTSHYFRQPSEKLLGSFMHHSDPIIIPVYKRHHKVLNIFIWRLNQSVRPLTNN